MKTTIKDVGLFKKLISLASNMANSLTDSLESYIFFSVKNDVLTLTSGMSGSHLCQLDMDVHSSKEGNFAVSGKDILDLSKVFSTDTLILSVSNGQLNITAPTLGTRSLPLYIGNTLSENLLSLADYNKDYQVKDSSSLSKNLRSIMSFISTSRWVRFSGTKDAFTITGSNDLGYIKCFDLGVSEDFSFSLDPISVLPISQLGEVLSLSLEDNVVRFTSDLGSIWFITSEDEDTEYGDLDQVLAVDTSGYVMTDRSLVMSALNWQGHGHADIDSTSIGIDKDNKLSILGSGSKPSALSLSKKVGTFDSVQLNTAALNKSVACLSKGELISIEQRQIKAGSIKVKITSFVPDEKKGSYIITVMYEQISI